MHRLEIFPLEKEGKVLRSCMESGHILGHSQWSHWSYLERYYFPYTLSSLLSPFQSSSVWLVLKIFSKLYFIIIQSLNDSQFGIKCCVMMIVSSFKLCIRNTSGYGVNFKHCHKPARLKYVTSLSEPTWSSGVIAFIQSNEIVHFLVRPLKKK